MIRCCYFVEFALVEYYHASIDAPSKESSEREKERNLERKLNFFGIKERTPLKNLLAVICYIFVVNYYFLYLAVLFGSFFLLSFLLSSLKYNFLLAYHVWWCWYVAIARVVMTVAKSFNMYIFGKGENVSCINVCTRTHIRSRPERFFFSLPLSHFRVCEYKTEVNSRKNAGNQITFIMTTRWKQ